MLNIRRDLPLWGNSKASAHQLPWSMVGDAPFFLFKFPQPYLDIRQHRFLRSHPCIHRGKSGTRLIRKHVHCISNFYWDNEHQREIASVHQVHSFKPGSVHSGLANWDDCCRAFPDKLRVSLFPWWVPRPFRDNMISPLRLRWFKGVCLFRCNLPPTLLAEWPWSFMCRCDNTGGGTDTEEESEQKKKTLEMEILPRSYQDSNSQPFDQESGAHQLSCTSYPSPLGWHLTCLAQSQ